MSDQSNGDEKKTKTETEVVATPRQQMLHDRSNVRLGGSTAIIEKRMISKKSTSFLAKNPEAMQGIKRVLFPTTDPNIGSGSENKDPNMDSSSQ